MRLVASMRCAWLLLLATACTSTEPSSLAGSFPPARNPRFAELEAHAVKAPPAPPAEWSRRPPTETALKAWDGCLVPARGVRVSLSTDGTSAGVFLSNMSGHVGELSIDPLGRSGARISFGAAYFDTPIDLESTTFRPPTQPTAAIGGILYLARHAGMRIAGGSKAALDLLPMDSKGELRWVTPPTQSVACADLTKRPDWKAVALPVGDNKRSVVLRGASSGVRVTEKGPVVAQLRVPSAGVVDEREGVLLIRADTSMGEVIGYVDSRDWQPMPEPKKQPGRAGGSGGIIGWPTLRCPFGAALYLQRNDQLCRVGHLRDATDPALKTVDIRVRGEVIVLQPGGLTPVGPFAVLRDDFRLTNDFWHDGVGGAFVVPADVCK